jgi:hypothetical protein
MEIGSGTGDMGYPVSGLIASQVERRCMYIHIMRGAKVIVQMCCRSSRGRDEKFVGVGKEGCCVTVVGPRLSAGVADMARNHYKVSDGEEK